MSHFITAVLLDGSRTVEQLMAPYEEQYREGDQFAEFSDMENDMKLRWCTESVCCFRTDDGPVPEWKFRDWKMLDDEEAPHEKAVREHGEPVEVPVSEAYDSFDRFCIANGMEQNSFGTWGRWENPNARWDCYEVLPPQEYWNRLLELEGDTPPLARDAIGLRTREKGELEEMHTLLAERRRAFKAGEPAPDDGLDWGKVWNLSGLAAAAKSAGEFAEAASLWTPFAILTPDGKWHEAGKMGWWGLADMDDEDELAWVHEAQEIMEAHAGCRVEVLKCHI